MFIKNSFVDEIATSMERQLVDGVINKQAEAQAQLVKAANYLNAAAEIFDESGLDVQAELITAVLESLAAKKKVKPKSKSKAKKEAPKKKEMTSDKMVSNLKEKGWMFDESGAHDQNFVDDNCALCGSMSGSKDKSYAKDESEDMDNEELLSMLKDFKTRSGDDFEDESDLHDPDTFSEDDLHPSFKMSDESRGPNNDYRWKSPMITYNDD